MSRKRVVWTCDAETDPFRPGRIPIPFDFSFFDGSNHHEFYGPECVANAVAYVESLNRELLIFAHNGGKFDFHFLLPFIGDDVELFVVNGRILKLKWGKIEFRDSYAIIPAALKVSGRKKEIAYWKLEKSEIELTPSELSEFHSLGGSGSPREFFRAEITEYRRQDNVALHEWVTRFISDYGLGLTIANRAFSELKKLGITPQEGNAEFDAIFRNYYYGGRVQCFETGIIERPGITCIDIKSAYPFAMLSSHFWGYSFIESKVAPKNRERCCASFFTVDATSRGAFPIRTKTGISFPVGRNIFNVTGWEYLAAIETGTADIHSIKKCLVPYDTQSFRPFVEKFYALKESAEKAGDASGRLFAKIFLNSAYGRFAINPEKFRTHLLLPIGESPEEHDAKEVKENPKYICRNWSLVNIFDDAGFCLYEAPADPEEMRYYNVATAASVTGYVRAYLWRAIQRVKNPLYCDTDSIICENIGNLETGKTLGAWDIEKTGNRIDICGKKLYCFHTADGAYKIASKGVKLNHLEIERIAKGEIVHWSNAAPSFSLKTGTHFVQRNVKMTVDNSAENDLFEDVE